MSQLTKILIVTILAALIISVSYALIEKKSAIFSDTTSPQEQEDEGIQRTAEGLSSQPSASTTKISEVSTNSAVLQQDITFSVSGKTLSMMENGELIQTITLDEMGEFALNLNPVSIKSFITENDVNFDGYNDVAVLTSTGYGGVNLYYDYYLYIPQTKRLEMNPILTELSNPEFDLENGKIISLYRSGPEWYTETFQWNGTTYIKTEVASEAANNEY